jgi:Zn-dependent protease
MVGGTAQRPLFRFHVAGIPVDVQPWFALVVGVGALQLRTAAAAAAWAVVVATSVLWHELGHSLAMRRFGYEPSIELHAVGGFAHWPPGASPTARQSLVVSAAGPAAGLLLGGAVWALARQVGPLPGFAGYAVAFAVWVNVAWSLFNLLPMLPLDGGRVVDHLSEIATGRSRPRWVGWASALTGGGIVLYAMSHQTMYLALLGAFGVAQGITRIKGSRGHAFGGATVSVTARPPPPRARARRALERGNVKAAVAALLPEARLGRLEVAELSDLIGGLVELGRLDELVALCRDRLGTFARREDAGPLARLAAGALAEAGAHAHALEVSQLAFRQLGVPYHAYEAAGHLVRLGRPEEAVRWIEHAIDAGLDCGHTLLTDPDLEPLRDRPDFLEVVARGASRKTSA